MLIVSNFDRIEASADQWPGVRIEYASTGDASQNIQSFLDAARRADVILLNSEGKLLNKICLSRWSTFRRRPRLVVVDLLLNKPISLPQRMRAVLHRQLFKSVDLFVHYFRDWSDYDRYYGIGSRSVYVPFKSNIWERCKEIDVFRGGGYVLAAGRSLRDYPTFLEAMRIVKYPARIVLASRHLLHEHGSMFDQDKLPSNVEIHFEDGDMDTWIEHLRGAKLIAIPIQEDAIRSCGISLCLEAMTLGKPVVMTEGPTTTGIFTDELIHVPARDPNALAKAIANVWENRDTQEELARKGRRYAESVQGEKRLYRDLMRVACASS